MRWPRKSVFTALILSTFMDWPYADSILITSIVLLFCMCLNVLPLVLLSKRKTLHFSDHWFGPCCEPFEGTPSFKHLLYLLGPLSNIGVGIYAYQNLPHLTSFTSLPILWGIFRLMPIEPFEGWFALRGLFKPFLGYTEKKVSYFISGLIFCFLCLYGLFSFTDKLYWLAFVALGTSFYCFQNYWHFRKRGPADDEPHLLALYYEAIDLFKQNLGLEADKKLLEIIESGIEGTICDQARVIYAKGLLEQANPQKAKEIIAPCLKRSPSGVIGIMHRIAYQSDDFETVQKLSQKAWREENNSSVAMMNAIATSRLYQKVPSKRLIEEVLGWLGAAQRMGYFPWDVLSSPDFIALQNEPLFEQFRNKVQKK